MFALGTLLWAASGNQPNVAFPAYYPPLKCVHGCGPWPTEYPYNSSLTGCMIPGAATGKAGPVAKGFSDGVGETVTGAWAGPFCFCATDPAAAAAADSTTVATTAGYCRNPLGIPEQINLQLASQDTVVVAFVTYEIAKPTQPPQARFTRLGASAPTTAVGITHWYVEGSNTSQKDGPHTGRNFSMHFVRLGPLKPRTTYTYQVKGGGTDAVWSDTFTFRSVYTAADGGATRVGIFGDIAITAFNAVGNLAADCAAGTIDAIWVMGDHAYDLGMDNDRRGDAYMNGIAPATATCPWVPVMGNHEASDGDHYNRYLNQTWGEAYGNPKVDSTADTALGHLLSKGTLFGASSHGASPSGTSRYFSVDIGLIHFVGLDLNAPETTPRTIGLDAGQLAWLAADLAAADANRAAVPWIVVTSHFPMYLSSAAAGEPAHGADSARWYLSDEAEAAVPGVDGTLPESRSCGANGEGPGCRTVDDVRSGHTLTLEPLLHEFGVDFYAAGHSHLYGVTWPMANGTATQKDYIEPKATIYITEGNGGVPGAPGVHKFTKPAADYMRIGATGGAHGRMIATNGTVLTYEHVFNNGNGGAGEVMEQWSVVQHKHGTFPSPAVSIR